MGIVYSNATWFYVLCRETKVTTSKNGDKPAAAAVRPATVIDQVFVTETRDEEVPEDDMGSRNVYDMETRLQKEYEVALMHELKGKCLPYSYQQ